MLPNIGVTIFAKAFVVESVDLSDLTGLVIPSENGDALRIADFEGYKEGDSLN